MRKSEKNFALCPGSPGSCPTCVSGRPWLATWKCRPGSHPMGLVRWARALGRKPLCELLQSPVTGSDAWSRVIALMKVKAACKSSKKLEPGSATECWGRAGSSCVWGQERGRGSEGRLAGSGWVRGVLDTASP